MERNGNEQRGEKRRGRRWGEEGRGNSSGKRVEAVPRKAVTMLVEKKVALCRVP